MDNALTKFLIGVVFVIKRAEELGMMIDTTTLSKSSIQVKCTIEQ